VNHTARSARTPFLRTGIFAVLSDSLRGGGSGAPSPSLFGFAPSRPSSPEISLGRSASRRLLAPFALAIAALLALAASSASAAQTHAFSISFGSEGTGAGQLNEPSGLAVNEATHDIYVADTGNNRVEKFGSAANFLLAFVPDLSIGAPA
jgi:hypothetical protein